MTTQWKKRTIAIYTRKNCSDAKRDAMLAYIRQYLQCDGITILELFHEGDDSDEEIERPALQRLLRQIRTEGIDCVVVNTIESIATSLTHFTWLMAYFAHHHVDFVSVTPHYDSSTPVGHLTLDIIKSIGRLDYTSLANASTANQSPTNSTHGLDCSDEESDSFRANTATC